jgi:Raf kinase inhibitor-like YbhB/YbcL family protein
MFGRHMKRHGYGLLIWGVALMAACSGSGSNRELVEDQMKLTSTAFAEGADIPALYTCDGADISPPLQWSDPPAGTASLALIMDDPDAPARTWVHWVVYDLPGETTGLPENVDPTETIPGGGRQGNSSWNRIGYGGPCPPRGSHRYFFKLYALDSQLGLESGASKAKLLEAMTGHILAEAQLMGHYER